MLWWQSLQVQYEAILAPSPLVPGIRQGRSAGAGGQAVLLLGRQIAQCPALSSLSRRATVPTLPARSAAPPLGTRSTIPLLLRLAILLACLTRAQPPAMPLQCR